MTRNLDMAAMKINVRSTVFPGVKTLGKRCNLINRQVKRPEPSQPMWPLAEIRKYRVISPETWRKKRGVLTSFYYSFTDLPGSL